MIHVGLDVAKLTLQADLAGRSLALPNTPADTGGPSLAGHLEKIETEITALLAASAEVKARVVRLTQARGVGAVSAYSLLAHLPMLGQLSRGAIAALAGVAPMNADSAAMRGQRHIRGGRAPARKALYMAALCATLHNPLLKPITRSCAPRVNPPKSPWPPSCENCFTPQLHPQTSPSHHCLQSGTMIGEVFSGERADADLR